MRTYTYFIASILLAVSICMAAYMANYNILKRAGETDLYNSEVSINALQPPIKAHDVNFKGQFETEFDRTIKTLKKIKDNAYLPQD